MVAIATKGKPVYPGDMQNQQNDEDFLKADRTNMLHAMKRSMREVCWCAVRSFTIVKAFT